MLIYFNTDEDPKDLFDLFDQLFSADCSNAFRAVRTYSDKECTISQCHYGARRSIIYMYAIANTYFPEVSNEDVIKVLLNLKKTTRNNIACTAYPNYCGSIHEPVFSLRPYEESRNLCEEVGTNGTNWKDIFASYGINSHAELNQFLNTGDYFRL